MARTTKRTKISRWKLATIGVMSSAAVYSGLVFELAHSATLQNQQRKQADLILNQQTTLAADIAQKQAVLKQLQNSINQVQTHTKQVQAKLRTVQQEIKQLKSGLSVSVQSVASVQTVSPSVSVPSSSSSPPVQSVTRASAP